MSLKYILGKPNDIKKDVLISLVKSDKAFEIEDINPQKISGMPSYLIKIDCLYLEDNFKYKYINTIKLEENLSSALDGMTVFNLEIKNLNISFIENFNITYTLGTSLFLIARKFTDYTFTVFLKDFKDRNILVELDRAIHVLKENESFRKISPTLFGKGVLTQAQESIVKRTFKLENSFKGKTLLIADTYNRYHQAWHGMGNLRSDKDEPTGVIKNFTTFVKGISKFDADYIIFASEGQNGIRYQIDENYKGTRSKVDDDLTFQIKACNSMIKKMGFSLIAEEGFEADDIIGSYTRLFESLGGKVIILTSDKDMYQLLSDNVQIHDPLKKRFILEEDWIKKFELPPEKILYSLAIQGDTSDNVPGVKGIGYIGAAKLINAYGDVEGVIANIDKLKEGAQKKNLENGIDNLRMSLELVRLYDFLAIDTDFTKFRIPTYNPLFLVQDELERFNINV